MGFSHLTKVMPTQLNFGTPLLRNDTVTKLSSSRQGKRVLDLLEESHGGRQMPTIGNKFRWKAPWPMTHGNTVTWATHRDGSQTISAMGRAAGVTREGLGPEDQIKRIGMMATEYAIWRIEEH